MPASQEQCSFLSCSSDGACPPYLELLGGPYSSSGPVHDSILGVLTGKTSYDDSQSLHFEHFFPGKCMNCSNMINMINIHAE